MEILQGLDKGNKVIMRCRDTLAQLLIACDFDGMQQSRLVGNLAADDNWDRACGRIHTRFVLFLPI
jgi:hypothetical protein